MQIFYRKKANDIKAKQMFQQYDMCVADTTEIFSNRIATFSYPTIVVDSNMFKAMGRKLYHTQHDDE